MKKLALKNPESVTAEVVLEVGHWAGYCDFCEEEAKPFVKGKPIHFTEAIHLGKGYADWEIFEKEVPRGMFSPPLRLKVLNDLAVRENRYMALERSTTPFICFDCIRQLARLIPKE